MEISLKAVQSGCFCLHGSVSKHADLLANVFVSSARLMTLKDYVTLSNHSFEVAQYSFSVDEILRFVNFFGVGATPPPRRSTRQSSSEWTVSWPHPRGTRRPRPRPAVLGTSTSPRPRRPRPAPLRRLLTHSLTGLHLAAWRLSVGRARDHFFR